MFNLKKITQIIFIFICSFSFVSLIFATYESERQDIYDYREFFDDLYPEEETEQSCSTIGTVYDNCSGVTVGGKTVSLDEYVAGVVKGEFGGSASNDENRYKISMVNAIAARSFLMAQTGCTSVISSASFQVYRQIDPSDHYDQIYLKAAQDTAGIVMMRKDKYVTGYFVTVPTSKYITKSNGNWTFNMLGDANDPSTSYTYTMPEADIFRIASYTGGLIYPDEGSDHHWGIPTVGAAYEVEKGTSTEEILKMFYGNDISLAKLNTSGSSSSSSSSNNSFVCNDDEDGEYVMSDDVKFVSKNYNIEGTSEGLGSSFDLTASNVSQCPWYAKYRAIEIIESSSLSSDLKEKAKAVLLSTSGNGNQWYGGNNSSLSYFKYTSDVTKPKAGSIVSWQRNSHNYGHVGIVEKVNSDGTVVISEGWNRFGADSTDSVNSIKIITRTMTIDQIKTYDGTGSFIGYTYLLSHKK